jgi:Family of unknown function (DUF6186)
MSSRAITIAGFLAIGVAWIALELAGRSRRTRVPTFAAWLDLLMGYRYGRVGVLLVWWWLGWHFLAR